jgi:hypothetical protein
MSAHPLRWRVFLSVITGTALAMGLHILLDLLHAPDAFAPHLLDKYIDHLALVMTHGIAGAVATLLGPWQFMPAFRRRSVRTHRIIGGVYVLCVFVGAATGLVMSTMAYGGLAARIGFEVLSIAWAATTFVAVLRVMQHDFTAHRAWMLRSFTLTMSAVLVRLWLRLCESTNLTLETSYMISAWISWVPSLVLMELLLWRGTARSGLLLPPRQESSTR